MQMDKFLVEIAREQNCANVPTANNVPWYFPSPSNNTIAFNAITDTSDPDYRKSQICQYVAELEVDIL